MRAENMSARINEAYRTLQSPLSRAQYLLGLRSMDVTEDEAARTEDKELLMEVLEMREQVEEAQAEEEIDALRQVNGARVRASVEQLANAFAKEDLEAAKRETVRLRYWVNIDESLAAWEKGKPVVLEH